MSKTAANQKIIAAVHKLFDYYKNGSLRGEVMPEDANPGLLSSSEEALRYFTLPMALNYQRNSYKLWQSALAAYQDKETEFLFKPDQVVGKDFTVIQKALLKHKVGLQPVKHTQIWITLCETLMAEYQGKILNFLTAHHFDIEQILHILHTQKKKFPYLAGPKISNYWLYVLTQYTGHDFKNLDSLSIAPDTHVMQASVHLGLVPSDSTSLTVAESWKNLLVKSGISPIQVHTPLWLWSRQGFKPEV